MTYRKFETSTWHDPWFEGLSPKGKLVFIYLFTNESCNQAGIYNITEKRIFFDTGYHMDTIYLELEDKIYWKSDQNIVWVRNFFRWQCQNPKFAVGALNSIKDNPILLQLFIPYNFDLLNGLKIDLKKYSMDTVCLSEQNRTEQSRSRTEQNRIDPSPAKPKKPTIPFDEIIQDLNQKANTGFKNTSSKTKDLIRARFNDGFCLKDFQTVHAKKVAEWHNTEYAKFLRPETLYGTKFEGYLNQKSKRPGSSKTLRHNLELLSEIKSRGVANEQVG